MSTSRSYWRWNIEGISETVIKHAISGSLMTELTYS